MDLDFHVRVRTCKKRVTGKQPHEYFKDDDSLYTLHIVVPNLCPLQPMNLVR